jgi:glutathione S-transferase
MVGAASNRELPGGSTGAPLYHLALAANWAAAVEAGEYRTSGLGMTLEEEGFIHCSLSYQLQRTADRFYRGRDDVLLLTIDPARLTAPLLLESNRPGGEAYPHLYGPLNLDAVVDVGPVELRADGQIVVGI